jgi:hypothetical protein
MKFSISKKKYLKILRDSQLNEQCLIKKYDNCRELDEDTAIEDHMSNYAAVKPLETKKMFPKILKLKKKKKKNRDNEKDIDTSEVSGTATEETDSKEKKKKSAKKKLLNYASKKLAFPHS